jgi:hypothetical protein
LLGASLYLKGKTMARNYRAEYDNYHAQPQAKLDRAQRNKARGILAKDGMVHKGDGKDVDHTKPLSKGGTSTRSNLKVKTASNNRSFKRKSDGSMK